MSNVVLLNAKIGELDKARTDYLANKQVRLTPSSLRGYSDTLKFLVADLGHVPLKEFEPPWGTILLEDFLSKRWGHCAGRTFNKHRVVLRDFFRWLRLRGYVSENPALAIEKAREADIAPYGFTPEERARILAVNPEPRDQIAIRLMLDYGLRKGSVLDVKIGSFDRGDFKVSFWMKGERHHTVPVPEQDPIWQLLDELDGEPAGHYILFRQVLRRRRSTDRELLAVLEQRLAEAVTAAEAISDPACEFETDWVQASIGTAVNWLSLACMASSRQVVREYRDQPLGAHAMHDRWYWWLARAGLVPFGVTHGRRMHGARHAAGQRVLEQTGNLKAVQRILGHRNISTTGNTYVHIDDSHAREALAATVPPASLDADLLARASTAVRERR